MPPWRTPQLTLNWELSILFHLTTEHNLQHQLAIVFITQAGRLRSHRLCISLLWSILSKTLFASRADKYTQLPLSVKYLTTCCVLKLQHYTQSLSWNQTVEYDRWTNHQIYTKHNFQKFFGNNRTD